jgi:membrane protein DedA with SNARE-associated domain
MSPALNMDLLLDSPLVIVIALVAVLGDALLPLLPSGTLVLAASLWATTHEAGSLWLAAAVAAASVLGDVLVVRLAQGRLRERPSMAAAARRVEGVLAGQLGRTTVAARFVPGGRTVLAVAVGTAGVSQRRYLGWSAAGGILWAGYLTGLGRLNSLWFDAAWLGFAVSVLASLVIGSCLARALSARALPATPAPSDPSDQSDPPEGKDPAGRDPQDQVAGGPLPHRPADTDPRSVRHPTHPLKPQRAHTVRSGAEETPVRRATAPPWTRRESHRCTTGSSLARGALQRCARRLGPGSRRTDTGADADTSRTSNSRGLRPICRTLTARVMTVCAAGTHRNRRTEPATGAPVTHAKGTTGSSVAKSLTGPRSLCNSRNRSIVETWPWPRLYRSTTCRPMCSRTVPPRNHPSAAPSTH